MIMETPETYEEWLDRRLAEGIPPMPFKITDTGEGTPNWVWRTSEDLTDKMWYQLAVGQDAMVGCREIAGAALNGRLCRLQVEE